MLERGVVVDCGPRMKTGDGPGDQVALGRMQIAARWIDPERPTRTARLLPGGEGERVLKELGDRDPVQRSSGDVTEGERRLIARLRPHREEIERQPSGALESAERIGLRVPIHVAESGARTETAGASCARDTRASSAAPREAPAASRNPGCRSFQPSQRFSQRSSSASPSSYLAATRPRSATSSVGDRQVAGGPRRHDPARGVDRYLLFAGAATACPCTSRGPR